ncbi:MAG: hypothetical protein KC609_04320, partial [Myxococcales bacterium]|nr:hypothetical protein [Myxococcales bacterium]
RRLDWLGLDRPAGALLGAVACVAVGVLTPSQALAAVHGPTLLLLFGVMGMGAFLAIDGFFDAIEGHLLRLARTPARLLASIVWGAGALSAVITNDAVCLLGAPLVVRLIEKHRLPRLPFLLALATGSNTGSVATLVGNPQNMLCAALGSLGFREHLLVVAPLALLALAVNHAILYLVFRRALDGGALVPHVAAAPLKPRVRLTLIAIAATLVVYTVGADLAWAATGGFVALMVVHRRDTRVLWSRIDWSLLLFFSGLFVVVEALNRSGAPAWVFGHLPLSSTGSGLAGALGLSGIFLVASNVVSNVPLILVIRDQVASLPHPELGWELLAVVSTFAGNLTLLGSVANVIVAESARDIGGIGFVEYLKVGVPLALTTSCLGAIWLFVFLG